VIASTDIGNLILVVLHSIMSKQDNPDADQNKSSSGVMHLEHEWILYYDEGAPKGQENTPFESFVKVIGQFSTVQDFWRYWNNIDVTKFPSYANLRLFKKDIKPIWEDSHNVKGGKWLIEPRNDDMSQLWLYCILPMIGERFHHSDEICGAVLSFRPKRKSISLWNRDASKREACDKTEADLRTFLKLHNPADIRYQSHSESFDFKPSDLKASAEAQPRASRVQERHTAQLSKKSSFDEDEDTFSSPFIELTKFEPAKSTTAAPSPSVREKSDRLSARAAKYKHHKTSSQHDTSSAQSSTGTSTAQPPSPQRSYSVGSLQHLYSLYEQHKARRSARKSSTDNTKKSTSTAQSSTALNLSLNATALVSPRNVLANSLTTPPVSRRRLRRSRRSDSQTGSWDKKDPLSSSLGGNTTSSDDESAPLSAGSGSNTSRHHRRSSSSYSAGKEMIIHGHHSRHHSRHYSRDNSATPVNDNSASATHDSNHKSPQIGGIPSQVVFICGTLLLVFVVMFCYRMIINSKVLLIQR
jgi:hypothetical protein